MTMPLAAVLPGKDRVTAFAVFGLLALFSAATHLAFLAVGRSTPVWLSAASVGVTLLVTALAAVAGRAGADDYDQQRRLARRYRDDVAEHAAVEPKFVL